MRDRFWEEIRQNCKSDAEAWDEYFQARDEWWENEDNDDSNY